MHNRRHAARHSLHVFFNKFIDGHPYLCRAVDISADGISCEVFTEPATRHDSFPLEIQLPGDTRSLWVWGKRVRAGAGRMAIRFLSLHADDRAALDRYLAARAA
jgi:hypothetical protein